jgi:hypothetical protein
MRLLRVLPFVAAIAALSLPAGAQSATSEEIVLPGDFSAADQYVESVPTSGGPHAAVDKPNVGKSVPLPPGISGRLTGKGGSQLKEVATSSKLGAPAKRLHRTERSSPSVPSAAVSAIDEGGSSMIWLLLALLLVTGVVVGTAGHRLYNQSKTPIGG